MHGRRRRKAPGLLVFRAVTALILALVLSVFSFATVTANTVSAVVIDGSRSYTFNMNSTDLGEILAQAEERGLTPLGPLDVAEQVENTTTVNIRRGVSHTVTESGTRRTLLAYRGDTVEQALENNNILLKENDVVEPSRDTEVAAGLSIEIRRCCKAVILVDGERIERSLIGETVAGALREAGVVLGDKDAVSHELTEPLFDNIRIRVSRIASVTVIADGETGEYELAVDTVRDALAQCGVELGPDDRLNVDLKDKVTDGMEIEVTRVVTEEVQETEEVDYPTQYVTSDELFTDEVKVKTPGREGEKIVTYKLFYVDGELDGKEAVSEEIVREPVTEVVIRGTKQRTNDSITSVGGAGTFTDAYGNTVAYSKVMVGECTAYHPINPGDITATGVVAGYGCIAVDPRIIPYGTRMYIVSPDGGIVYGYGTAVDTGGAAMAGDILADLCFDTRAECSIIGRRDMVIYILP